jgi:hypothetical protein
MARARAWERQFASLPPALADRKLCEYTRMLQLSALEQRVYAMNGAGIEDELDGAGPASVGLWKKVMAWLGMFVLTVYAMCAPQPPTAAARHRYRLVSALLCCSRHLPPSRHCLGKAPCERAR